MLSLSIGSASWFGAAAGDRRGLAALATFITGIATTVISLFAVMGEVRDRRSSRVRSLLDEVDRVSRDYR